jgi:hypothetical protein
MQVSGYLHTSSVPPPRQISISISARQEIRPDTKVQNSCSPQESNRDIPQRPALNLYTIPTELIQLQWYTLQAENAFCTCRPSVMIIMYICCCFGSGAYQHWSHEGLLYSNPPVEFRHSSPEALHTKRRERLLLTKDGTKAEKFS